jgi:hypothetical protein
MREAVDERDDARGAGKVLPHCLKATLVVMSEQKIDTDLSVQAQACLS